MIIRVTKRHIKLGKRFSTQNCPIALVLREQFAGYIHVGITHAMIGRKTCNFSARTMKFIRDFDFHRPVKPFNFRIKL